MSDERQPGFDSARSGWTEHNLSQLKYFRSLSLREKLEAVQGMADVVRRFREMRESGKFSATHSGPAVAPESDAHAVRQSPTPYGSNDE